MIANNNKIKNKNFFIYGLGKTGESALKFLKKENVKNLISWDDFKKIEKKIDVKSELDNSDFIVLSPGINLRKTKPKKIILYFMIEENRGYPQHLINLIKRTDKLTKKLSKNFENKPSYKYMWKKMTILTENFLFNYAKKNPHTQIIFKGKIGRIRDIQIHPINGKIFFLAGDYLWLMEKNF